MVIGVKREDNENVWREGGNGTQVFVRLPLSWFSVILASFVTVLI